MARTEQFTTEQIIGALQATQGKVALAAQRLGCSVHTIYQRAKKVTTIQTTIDEYRERQLDAAELQLYKLVQEGNLGAIIFYLKTQGKRRGWIERLEVDVNIAVVNETVRAIREAGEDPELVFKRLKEAAEARAHASKSG